MRKVKIKSFGVLKITDEAIASIESSAMPDDDPNQTAKKIINEVKRSKTGTFIGIDPSSRELFRFVPIIDNGRFFVSKFPDPIQLYYSLAYWNYQSSVKTRKNIVTQNNQSSPLNFVNGYLYNWHLQYKISTIIFLHSTVEAFINYIMPEEFVYRQEYIAKTTEKFLKNIKEYNKEQTERYILYKEKLGEVIKQITGIDLQTEHKKTYDSLLNLNTLRNEIIHLRSTQEQNQHYFEKVFEEVINVNLLPYVNTVKDFINTIRPNFIEMESFTSKKQDEYVFNFKSYQAFKIDITIFLKILEAPVNIVKLVIPKSSDERFQSTITWVLQNLNIMAESNLIYFPIVNTNLKENLVIEVIRPAGK